MIQHNGKGFLAIMAPMKSFGKFKHQFIFSCLTSKFSVVYDLGFKNCALVLNITQEQFITDHGIPIALIPMGTKQKSLVLNGYNYVVNTKLVNLVLNHTSKTKTK